VRLARAILSDVGLVGLAVVFGWTIWFSVREDLNETQRTAVQVIIESEPGLEVTPRTQTVHIEFQGARRAIDALRATQTPRIVRRLTLSDLPADANETRRDFGKDDFDFKQSLGVGALAVLDMDPPVISVKVFRVVKLEMSVAPPEFQGAAELGLKHVLQGYTNKAFVQGRVSVLSTFREIRTFVSREQLQGFAESLRDSPKTLARLVLEVHPSQKELFTLVEPSELSARVELSRVAEQEIVVPVRLFADAGTKARPIRRLQFAELNKPHFVAGDPPKVRVLVTGVPSALSALAASKVHAYVLESDLPGDQRNGEVPLHIADMPPGIALTQDYGVYVEESR
jgi:hypothetical protein